MARGRCSDPSHAACTGALPSRSEAGRASSAVRGRFCGLPTSWLNTDLRSLPFRECGGVYKPICPKNSSLILETLSIMGRGRELCELVRSSEGVFRSLTSAPHVRWVQNQQIGLPAEFPNKNPCARDVPPKSSGGATNRCVMSRLTKSLAPGPFQTGINRHL
jgi:hypothetical protein